MNAKPIDLEQAMERPNVDISAATPPREDIVANAEPVVFEVVWDRSTGPREPGRHTTADAGYAALAPRRKDPPMTERIELKRTPLEDEHRTLGAKLGPFAGWNMPIEYAGTLSEHRAVRERVGLFDLTHLGKIDRGRLKREG